MTGTNSINQVPASEWDRVFNRIKEKNPMDFGEYAGPDTVQTIQFDCDTFDPVKGYDPVQKPAHYNNGGIEAIDYIKQQLGDNFSAYCEGNVIKYLHRHKYKNGIEDLQKAQWYLNRMIEAWVE